MAETKQDAVKLLSDDEVAKKDLATVEAIIKETNSWGFIFTHNKRG